MNRTATHGTFYRLSWFLRGEGRRALLAMPAILRPLVSIVAWTVIAVFLGLIVGFAAVILPPMGAFGIVAAVALVLMWVTPDLPSPPTRLLPVLFFVVVLCMICVPNYYAVQVPGLPWITIRRLALVAVIVPFAFAIGSSSHFRAMVRKRLARSKLIIGCVLGFLFWSSLSMLTSDVPVQSLVAVADDVLTYYVAFFVAIALLDSVKKVEKLVRTICYFSLFVALIGMIEFFLQRRFYLDVMPAWYRNALMDANPAFAAMVNSSPYRNGFYRANSIFGVPLPFGEFEAMIFPLGLYYLLDERSMRSRLLGVAVIISAILGIFASGARGGYISMMAAAAAFAGLWLIRRARKDPGSLVPAVAGALVGCFAVSLGVLIMTWGRLHNVILGGGKEALSTDARWIQWDLLKPKLMHSPITLILGHGRGLSGQVIGYFSPGSQLPSVDSTILTLLADTGIPGTLLFFGIIVSSVWSGFRRCIVDLSDTGALAGGLACSALAFGVYRITLSAQENHFLFFMIVAALVALNDREAVR